MVFFSHTCLQDEIELLNHLNEYNRQLTMCRHILHSNQPSLQFLLDEVSDFDVLHSITRYQVESCTNSRFMISVELSCLSIIFNQSGSLIPWAFAYDSKFLLDNATTFCFLLFHTTRLLSRKVQYAEVDLSTTDPA